MSMGLTSELVAWTCAFARVAPFGLLVPFGGKFVPRMVSFSLVLVLALTTFSVSLSTVSSAGVESSLLVVRMARELCIGLLLVLACAAPIIAFAAVGSVADGLNAASSRGPYAPLHELFALTMFFSLGGHRALVLSITHSLRAAPLGDLRFARGSFLEGALTLGSDAVLLSVSLALPLLLAMWLSDLGLALLTSAFAGGARPLFGSPVRAIMSGLFVLVSIVKGVDALPDALRATLRLVDELVRAAFG